MWWVLTTDIVVIDDIIVFKNPGGGEHLLGGGEIPGPPLYETLHTHLHIIFTAGMFTLSKRKNRPMILIGG